MASASCLYYRPGCDNYLQHGQLTAFAHNSQSWRRAADNAGSHASRQRFLIYYLRGYLY